MNTAPHRIENQLSDKGYVPVYTTAVVAQPWDSYSADDHATWGSLYRCQRGLLVGRACDEFLRAQDAMGMGETHIPRFDALNQVLQAATGWTLVGVQGLLPELDFRSPRQQALPGDVVDPPPRSDRLHRRTGPVP